MRKEYWYPTAFSLWGDEERAAIDRVLTSGRLTMGEEVAAFEREFADWHGRKHGIMVNSGSSANLVAVAAVAAVQESRGGAPNRRWASVPALAWSTTYAPIVQHGYQLKLLDCDETWNAAVGGSWDRASIIIGCSILGNPAHLEAWKNRADSIGAAFIEDNCESLGASIDGKLCGTFGLLSTFSFFYSHQISAVEGGMILTDDDELAALCRVLRAHGWTRDVDSPSSRVFPGTFDVEYNFVAFGYNVRPVEMHAAIAREQLRRLRGMNWRRQVNYEFFCKSAAGLPIEHPRITSPGGYAPFSLHFKVKDSETRRRLAIALRAAGIDCRLPTGGSMRLHPYGKPWRDQLTPVADDVHRRGMFLGNAPFDISEKIERAVQVMRSVL